MNYSAQNIGNIQHWEFLIFKQIFISRAFIVLRFYNLNLLLAFKLGWNLGQRMLLSLGLRF